MSTSLYGLGKFDMVIRVVPASDNEDMYGQECKIMDINEDTITVKHLPDFTAAKFNKKTGMSLNGDGSFIIPFISYN